MVTSILNIKKATQPKTPGQTEPETLSTRPQETPCFQVPNIWKIYYVPGHPQLSLTYYSVHKVTCFGDMARVRIEGRYVQKTFFPVSANRNPVLKEDDFKTLYVDAEAVQWWREFETRPVQRDRNRPTTTWYVAGNPEAKAQMWDKLFNYLKTGSIEVSEVSKFYREVERRRKAGKD